MDYVIDTDSLEYKRVIAAGFTIDNLDIREDRISTDVIVSAKFTCVCGKKEVIQFSLPPDIAKCEGMFISGAPVKGNAINIAAFIEMAGSTSIRHLIDDGFSDDAIVNIRRAYKEDEAVVREKIKLIKETSIKKVI